MSSPPYHRCCCHNESIAIIIIEKEGEKRKEKKRKKKWKQGNKKYKAPIRNHCELKFPLRLAKFCKLVSFARPKIKMVRGFNSDLPFHFIFIFLIYEA
jgi:hypothetical protein